MRRNRGCSRALKAAESALTTAMVTKKFTATEITARRLLKNCLLKIYHAAELSKQLAAQKERDGHDGVGRQQL